MRSRVRAWIIIIVLGSLSCSHRRKPEQTPPHPDISVRTQIVTSSREFRARRDVFKQYSDPTGLAPECLIDIHTHTFNANYLPLPEIVHSRVSNVLFRFIAKAVVRTLQVLTSPPYDPEALDGADNVLGLSTGDYQENLDRILDDGVSPLGEVAAKELARVRDFIRGVGDDSDGSMPWKELRQNPVFREGVEFLRTIDPALVEDDCTRESAVVLSGGVAGKLKRIIPFIKALAVRDRDMPTQYRRRFGLDLPSSGVKKVIIATQQGSFGETYGGVGTGPDAQGLRLRRYRDYRTVLMPATEALQALPAQDTLFFATYDPFLDGREGLELAYDAVAGHSAYGFKYYPPSGSRAFGNPSPTKPSKRHKIRAWRSRYVEQGKRLTGNDLDRRIAAFLDWAIDSDLPVFTHSNPGEFEADDRYGYDFSSPYFWMKFMESGPERVNLRLCLGHASGPDFWFGTHDPNRPTAGWGAIAAHLAMKYPNVFIEIGIHHYVTNHMQRAHFQAVLETLEEIGTRNRKEFPYPISSKILYGSDWFMPIKVSHRKYFAAYVSTFAELDDLAIAGKRGWSDGFFRANALRYLNAEDRLARGVKVRRIDSERPEVDVRLVPSVQSDLAGALKSR